MLISSAYFRSMPEYARELSGQSEKIVHLDVDSERFARLLSFVNDGPEARARLDWPSLKTIAETGERYQFDIVPDLMARGAESILRSRIHAPLVPFSIFKFAARHDHGNLARLAIQCFNAAAEFDDVDGIAAVHEDLFNDVPGKYVAGFFQAMARTPPNDDELWDWHVTSSEFLV
jgi:hypothetical protein